MYVYDYKLFDMFRHYYQKINYFFGLEMSNHYADL